MLLCLGAPPGRTRRFLSPHGEESLKNRRLCLSSALRSPPPRSTPPVRQGSLPVFVYNQKLVVTSSPVNPPLPKPPDGFGPCEASQPLEPPEPPEPPDPPDLTPESPNLPPLINRISRFKDLLLTLPSTTRTDLSMSSLTCPDFVSGCTRRSLSSSPRILALCLHFFEAGSASQSLSFAGSVQICKSQSLHQWKLTSLSGSSPTNLWTPVINISGAQKILESGDLSEMPHPHSTNSLIKMGQKHVPYLLDFVPILSPNARKLSIFTQAIKSLSFAVSHLIRNEVSHIIHKAVAISSLALERSFPSSSLLWERSFQVSSLWKSLIPFSSQVTIPRTPSISLLDLLSTAYGIALMVISESKSCLSKSQMKVIIFSDSDSIVNFGPTHLRVFSFSLSISFESLSVSIVFQGILRFIDKAVRNMLSTIQENANGGLSDGLQTWFRTRPNP